MLAGLLLAGISVMIPLPTESTAAESPASRTIALDAAVRDRCLEILRNGMRSDEFWPSIHAAEALTLAGHGDEVRRFLEPKLATEEDDQRRCGLARELVRAGDRAKAEIMLHILDQDNPHGHVHAAESLYKVTQIGDGRALRRALAQTGNLRLRLMAAAALGKCGSPAAMRVLRGTLGHDDPEIRRIAAWVLGRIGDQRDIAPLKDGLKRASDPLTRCYFEHSLAALGDADGRQALLKNLTDDEPAVRVYAATFAGDARTLAAADQLEMLLDDDTLDVRIRAAQSLLVLSMPAPPDRMEDVSRDVYPATKDNPRYSEGSIQDLNDGTLLYATTEFIGSGSDFAKARIIARSSDDGGRTWSEPRVLQENIGERNVMSATFRRLERKNAPIGTPAPIGFFYLVKNSHSDLDVWLRVSQDEAQTFGEPVPVTQTPGYHVMNNDRILQLSTGRLLAPISSTDDVGRTNHFVAWCCYSDDGGRTWRKGGGQVDLPKRGAMEPDLFEREDGRVAMIMRTQLGHIAITTSDDGGNTWSEPASWSLPAPEAPSTVRRIPATGDLLLIWNNNYTPGAGHSGKRNPLTAAVSSDDGGTWRIVGNLERNPDHTYAYTSLIFVDGRAVMSYYVRDEKNGWISSRFRSLPVAWFYRDLEP